MTLKSYLFGFIVSIALTLGAYFIRAEIAIVTFAATQALLQLLLFFDLRHEDNPRWNLLVFLFMLLVLFILVTGSIWIMKNLDYNLMGT